MMRPVKDATSKRSLLGVALYQRPKVPTLHGAGMPLITQGFAASLRVGTFGRWYYLPEDAANSHKADQSIDGQAQRYVNAAGSSARRQGRSLSGEATPAAA